MAVRQIEYNMEWENGETFELKRRVDGGDWISIVTVEENANIREITAALQNLCLADMRHSVETAIAEMEA